MVHYILISVFALAITSLIYFVFLKNKGHLIFNRGYLLTTLLAALLIPLLPFTIDSILSFPLGTDSQLSLSEDSLLIPYHLTEQFVVTAVTANYTILSSILWSLFGIITSIFLLRFSIRFVRIIKLTKQKSTQNGAFQLIQLEGISSPFSFFKWIFAPKNIDLESDAFNNVLLHEQGHGIQYHSIDLILIEFAKCIFWFNPGIWFYARFIAENHEFLADRHVILHNSDPRTYAYSILQWSSSPLNPPPSMLTSTFAYRKVEARIKMLTTKNPKTMLNRIKLTLVILASAGLFILLSFTSKQIPTLEIGNPRNAKVSNNGTPNILPIQLSDILRFSSGFGMRSHPLNQKLKMHTGIDLIAPAGTSIVATADGTVIKAVFSTNYGNHVLIQHNNQVYKTQYAHLKDFKVKVGQKIKQGDVLGTIGNSGLATAIHLHYEVIENDKKVDPAQFFPVKLKPKTADSE